MSKACQPPHTPDGRYFVMVGRAGPRLWRATNPKLDPEEQVRLTRQLMTARRAVRGATDAAAIADARAKVDSAKVALGERGRVWWDDGAPDLNRRLVKGSCYSEWWTSNFP